MSWFDDNAPNSSGPTTPWGQSYDPSVGYNTGISGGMDKSGGLQPTGPQVTTGQNGLPRDAGGDWISQALSGAQSTDDPNYWRQVIAADPKVAAGDQSAIDYWKMRIAQGDGAAATRSGAQQPYGASSYGGVGGANPNDGLGFGSLTAPFTGQFTAPTAAQAEAQPGYQFARDQGLQAIDRSAASKGTLLTGGNLKDLAGYAGGVASTNYNNLFNQNATTFGMNRDTFYHNQDSPFNKLYQVSNMGKPTTP